MDGFDLEEVWQWFRFLLVAALIIAAVFGVGIGVGAVIWGF